MAESCRDVTAGGKDTGISLLTDDIDAYHAQLKDRGVDEGQQADGRRRPVTQSAGTLRLASATYSPGRSRSARCPFR
jgi:hypothetical protein